MRCLFIFSDASLSSNYSGGSSRHWNAYRALHQLGVDIVAWRILGKGVDSQIVEFESKDPNFYAEIKGWASLWEDSIYVRPSQKRSGSGFFLDTIFKPITFTIPEVDILREKFLEIVARSNPDLIWAETGLAAALVSTSKVNLPWIFGHTDFQYRIMQARQYAKERKTYFSEKLFNWALRRGEIAVLRKAGALISGSQTEAVELQSLGGKNIRVIPTSYDLVSLDLSDSDFSTPARIFHLGSLSTTANYLGLSSYIEKAQPNLLKDRVSGEADLYRLHIIGSTQGAKPALMEKLQAFGARFYGHVDDLSQILKPFDIAILPYELNTGTRTKLSLLFNHAQAVVAVRAAVAGSPEIKPGENCVLVSNASEFPDALISLMQNLDQRKRLGLNARRTFEEAFSFDAQLQKYQQVLNLIGQTNG